MTKLTSSEGRAIGPVAEEALRRWALALRIQQGTHARMPEEVHPFIAISREPGAGAGDVGRLVAAQLGCECLDNELLVHMAERYDLPVDLVRFVDETTSNLLREILRRWLDARMITQDEYVRRLGEIMLIAARHGPAVFVGRGAQYLLPRERGLAVRILAPLERRIAYTMEHRGIGRAAAEAWLREREQGQSDFIRKHFRRDVTDPRLYDLVINLERVDHQAAADLIAHAFRRASGPTARLG